MSGPLKPYRFEMDGSSYGELALPKPEGVSNNEITKAEEAWTRADWIRALDEAKSVFERLKNISEAMLPVDADSSKADSSKADSTEADSSKADSTEGNSSKVDSDAESRKAEKDLKVRQPYRAFVGPPEQALYATYKEGCTCRIDSAVRKEWAEAMRVGDCVTLLRALKANPCLLNFSPSPYDYPRRYDYYGYYGDSPNIQLPNTPNTVLQWATKRRCLKLLVYILSLFLDEDGKVVKEFVHCSTTVDRKDYFEKQYGTGLSAADLLWSVRNYSIYAYFSNFAKHRKSNLTLREMQLELLDPMYVPPNSASSVTSAAIPDENVRMREIVLKATKKHKRLLDDMHLVDYDYNFVEESDELLFHFACGHLDSKDCEEFVRVVIREVAKEGPKAVKYLFNYRNAQGLAPSHCAYIDLQNVGMFLELLQVELGTGEEYADCYNSRDVGGWTVLHIAASQGDEDVVKALLKEKRVDVNAEVLNREGNLGGTALHLAIIHDYLGVVRSLIEHGGADVNVTFRGSLSYKGIEKFELHCYTPLYLAIAMGRANIVKALIDHPQVEDGVFEEGNKISAIHIVAIKGDPKILRYLTNNPKFDISVTFKGCTALHFVVDGSHLNEGLYTKSMKEYFHDESSFGVFENENLWVSFDRKVCISMLIQAGLDIWQKNDEGHFPEPRPDASRDLRHFWYQKLLTETQDAKNNLNVAGNAISIISALVATASYVGPLQPPLGLDSNLIQDDSFPIRVYMVTNTLSFYMAIASIIFAVVPSLPMPQEGLYEEWQRSQKSIIYAIHLLLLAVITILISFGAASNVIVSSKYSWQHQGLAFYPTLLGGLICAIAISFFYLRLFRLAFVKNVTIKHIYQCVFRANKKEKFKVKVKNRSEDCLWNEDTKTQH